MAFKFKFVTVIFAAVLISLVSCIEDYCSVNQYSTHTNYMQFTKEPSTAEFAIVGNFKGLHCCAKGYRSIEWYKDGKPYPWHETVSQLIIYPESGNQTVYTRSVTTDDAGNYTCLLRNDSVVHVHTIFLRVFEKVPEDPKITYISDNTEVCTGQPVRLFCEAFVGRVDLPDAYNEAAWSKTGQNGSIKSEHRVKQNQISRENGQTLGAYLTIENLQNDDYGEYICTISKPGKTIKLSTYIYETKNIKYVNPNPVPFKKILIWSTVIVILLLTVLILYLRYGLPLRVYMKDRFGRLEEAKEKINDVLIVYSQNDSEFALEVLLPTLESKYNYKCGSRVLKSNINTWFTDLAELSQKSRQIIAILSPASLNGKWECDVLCHALKQLRDLDAQVCCISLAKFPSSIQIKNSQGETLSSILKNMNVIFWNNCNDDKFWLSLRLKLPPRKRDDCQLNVTANQNENSTRLNSNSLESLDILV